MNTDNESPALMMGNQIIAPADRLTKILPADLYQLIARPSAELRNKIQTLRSMQSFDQNQYRKQKTLLPYFCSSVFNPPFRKTENFASASFLILDIDHLQEAELNMQLLKEKIAMDARTVLLFTSPGSNGLKIMFRLHEKCFDPGKYSMFYKVFAKNFAQTYNLMQALDARTSDVARACFLSVDTEAYFNPDATPLEMSQYLDFEQPEQVHQAKIIAAEYIQPPATVAPPPDDVLLQIRQKLNPNVRTQKPKIIYVPEKLNEVISAVETMSEQAGMKLARVENIHYGKKLRFEAGNLWAEVNLFYGQRGFSVVKTPKRESSPELADLAHQMLCALFYPQSNWFDA